MAGRCYSTVPAVPRVGLENEDRAGTRIVVSAVQVKVWLRDVPSVGAIRQPHCLRCRVAAPRGQWNPSRARLLCAHQSPALTSVAERMTKAKAGLDASAMPSSGQAKSGNRVQANCERTLVNATTTGRCIKLNSVHSEARSFNNNLIVPFGAVQEKGTVQHLWRLS